MDFQKPQSHYRMTIKLSLRNWVLGAAAHCWRTWQSAGPHLSCVQEQPLPPRWAACWQGRRGWALGFLHRHIDLDLPKCDLGTSKPARPLCLQLGIIYVCVGRAPAGPWSLASSLAPWPRPHLGGTRSYQMGERGTAWWSASTKTPTRKCCPTWLPLCARWWAPSESLQPLPPAPPALPHLGAVAAGVKSILETCSCPKPRPYSTPLTLWFTPLCIFKKWKLFFSPILYVILVEFQIGNRGLEAIASSAEYASWNSHSNSQSTIVSAKD